MTNSKKESHPQNKHKRVQCTHYAPNTQTPILGTTLQRKVSTKIEISITHQQLVEATWLFEQYGKPKPGWLRRKFYINQRRRKCLNGELLEAQLDKAFCGSCCSTEDWAGLLHLLWHDINGEPLCV